MTIEQAHDLILNHAAQLSEHFEAVQILVSWTNSNGTSRVHAGEGNWYARQGMAHDFIHSDKAQDQARALGEVLRVEGDE